MDSSTPATGKTKSSMNTIGYFVSSYRWRKTCGRIIALFVLLLAGIPQLFSQSVAAGYSAMFTFGGTGYEPEAICGYSGMSELNNLGQYYTGYSDPFLLNSLPAVLNLDDMVIKAGQDLCFNANHTILASGFMVKNGGSAVLIAGSIIRFQPASTIEPGGYLHASITAENLFCLQTMNMLASAPQESILKRNDPPDENKNPIFRIFPNPTTGSFKVQVTTTEILTPLVAEIRNMFGTLLEKVTLQDLRHYVFDLSGMPNGVYLVRLIFDEKTGVVQLVKH